MSVIWHSQALHHFWIGAAGGALAAAHVDYAAFVTWTCWEDAAKYNWSVAAWRWFKGGVIGGISTGVLGTFAG